MNSPYPICSVIDTLENLPDGSVVRLVGWYLNRIGDGKYVLFDGSGAKTVVMYGDPPHYMHLFASGSNTIYGIDIHVRIVHLVDPETYFGWNSPHQYELYYYEPKPGACNCGAAHTFLPNFHSEWCEALRIR